MKNLLYQMDKQRYPKCNRGGVLFFLYFFRKAQETDNLLLKKIYRRLTRHYRSAHGLEIPDDLKVGGGFYIGHPYGITINPETILGENVNIHKGVTLGQENRGKRRGAPVIGSKVWIGINSSVVGNVIIGDDVLIAPNSFVNCDIPSHSIVFGNPCVIKHCDNATESYINGVAIK